MIFKRRKKSIEEMKSEIIRLIEENRIPEYKIVYYSLPEIRELLDKLIDRWEKNNRQGEPLDYASREELEILYDNAVKIAKKTLDELILEYRDILVPGYY